MTRSEPQPCAVVMTLRDGTVMEQVYPTRRQAELFLYLLPLLMATQAEEDQVARAILSPLVEGHGLDPHPLTSPRRFEHRGQ